MLLLYYSVNLKSFYECITKKRGPIFLKTLDSGRKDGIKVLLYRSAMVRNLKGDYA